MATETSVDDVPLPTNWPSNVRSAILQVVSLARVAIIYSRRWASDRVSSRVRLQASLDRSCSNQTDLGPPSLIDLFPLFGFPRVSHLRPAPRATGERVRFP
jgi:hypothetical protein